MSFADELREIYYGSEAKAIKRAKALAIKGLRNTAAIGYKGATVPLEKPSGVVADALVLWAKSEGLIAEPIDEDAYGKPSAVVIRFEAEAADV